MQNNNDDRAPEDTDQDAAHKTTPAAASNKPGKPLFEPLRVLWGTLPKQITKNNTVEILRTFEILSGLSRTQLFLLSQQLHHRRFLPAELFFEKGQAGHALYLILRGRVNVYYREPTSENFIAKIGPGQFFGEVALLHPESGRSATLVADTEVECYALFKSDLEGLLKSDPKLAAHIYREIARSISARLISMITQSRTDLDGKHHVPIT